MMLVFKLRIHPGRLIYVNMEPEDTRMEKEKHLPNHHFQILREEFPPGKIT